MKDKEMIEEMAKEIFNTCAWRFGRPNDYKELFNDIAEDLTEQGYRKLPEDSVVLSRKEYERLTVPTLFIKPQELNQKLAEKLKNEKYGIIGVDNSSIEIIPTRAEIEKETAEKIITKIKQSLNSVETIVGDTHKLQPEIGYSMREVDDLLDELAKEFGV